MNIQNKTVKYQIYYRKTKSFNAKFKTGHHNVVYRIGKHGGNSYSELKLALLASFLLLLTLLLSLRCFPT